MRERVLFGVEGGESGGNTVKMGQIFGTCEGVGEPVYSGDVPTLQGEIDGVAAGAAAEIEGGTDGKFVENGKEAGARIPKSGGLRLRGCGNEIIRATGGGKKPQCLVKCRIWDVGDIQGDARGREGMHERGDLSEGKGPWVEQPSHY